MACESSHDGQRCLSVDVFNVLLKVFPEIPRTTVKGREKEWQ